jgi:ribonuclease P protein component
VPLTSTGKTLGEPFEHEGMMANAVLGNRPDTMPAKKAAEFPRTARLLRHADFDRVYRQGRRHFSVSMTVFYWPRPEIEAMAERMGTTQTRVSAPGLPPQGLRIGFTVGRVLGGAVVRNRMKRRLREAVRLSRPLAAIEADVVINPKKSLATAEFTDVLREVKCAFAVIEQKLSGNRGTRTGASAPHKS